MPSIDTMIAQLTAPYQGRDPAMHAPGFEASDDTVRNAEIQGWNHHRRYTVFDNFVDLPAVEGAFDIAADAVLGAGTGTSQELGATVSAAIEAAAIRNRNWMVVGTDVGNGTIARFARGGVTLTTHTTSADQMVLVPNNDSGFDGGTNITYDPDYQPWIRAVLSAAVTSENCFIGVGFKITTTGATMFADGTDDDQAFIKLDIGTNGASANILAELVESSGGASPVDTQTAFTTDFVMTYSYPYLFEVRIDRSRYAHAYVNKRKVATSTNPIAADATTIKPFVGIQTDETGASAVNVHAIEVSQNLDIES